jgi:mycobactin lysine-N-oxygenase
VFDPQTLSSIAYDDNCRFVTGRVRHVSSTGHGPVRDQGVCVEYSASSGDETRVRHDYVVNCTGFDLLEQLRGLFGPAVRAAIESRVGAIWDRPPGVEIPIGRQLELQGMRPRLYIPGLGALNQGPGFANLGCLGLLANRVLEPFFADEARQGRSTHDPIREVV